MTLEGIEASDKVYLTPADVADILQSDPQTLRLTYELYPEHIHYPVTRTGNRWKISRQGFLNWVYGKNET